MVFLKASVWWFWLLRCRFRFSLPLHANTKMLFLWSFSMATQILSQAFQTGRFLHAPFSAPLILSRLAPTQHSTYGSPEMIRHQFQFQSAWEAIQHLRAFRAANHLEEMAGYAYSWCRDPLVSSSLGAILLFHGVSISNTYFYSVHVILMSYCN